MGRGEGKGINRCQFQVRERTNKERANKLRGIKSAVKVSCKRAFIIHAYAAMLQASFLDMEVHIYVERFISRALFLNYRFLLAYLKLIFLTIILLEAIFSRVICEFRIKNIVLSESQVSLTLELKKLKNRFLSLLKFYIFAQLTIRPLMLRHSC